MGWLAKVCGEQRNVDHIDDTVKATGHLAEQGSKLIEQLINSPLWKSTVGADEKEWKERGKRVSQTYAKAQSKVMRGVGEAEQFALCEVSANIVGALGSVVGAVGSVATAVGVQQLRGDVQDISYKLDGTNDLLKQNIQVEKEQLEELKEVEKAVKLVVEATRRVELRLVEQAKRDEQKTIRNMCLDSIRDDANPQHAFLTTRKLTGAQMPKARFVEGLTVSMQAPHITVLLPTPSRPISGVVKTSWLEGSHFIPNSSLLHLANAASIQPDYHALDNSNNGEKDGDEKEVEAEDDSKVAIATAASGTTLIISNIRLVKHVHPSADASQPGDPLIAVQGSQPLLHHLYLLSSAIYMTRTAFLWCGAVRHIHLQDVYLDSGILARSGTLEHLHIENVTVRFSSERETDKKQSQFLDLQGVKVVKLIELGVQNNRWGELLDCGIVCIDTPLVTAQPPMLLEILCSAGEDECQIYYTDKLTAKAATYTNEKGSVVMRGWEMSRSNNVQVY